MTESTKIALITGAAQRIGASIANELHQQGFNVVIHYRQSEAAARDLSQQLNQRRPQSAACLQADLNSVSAAQQLATDAIQLWGKIDVLVNNASSFFPTEFGQTSEADWDTLLDSNLKGPFFLSQALASTLTNQRGSIINIVDVHAERPLKEHAIYCVAKAGLAMMTQTLAKELAPDVRVNGVSPGAILWPEQALNADDKNSILDKIPLQRIGDTTDIARTVAFLALNAPYISGQIIAVDGGRSLNM